ncbi:MAG: protein kinase domain-containing protein [Verrucomicrobiaceae bacterium]
MSDEPITFEAPDPEELSALIPSYDVTQLIAVGGMGAVYEAVQTSLDRKVAIKLLPAEFADESFRKQFAAEARAMAQLNHPNLIGIYDFGEADGMPYIVMEHVPGKSLYYSSYNKKIDQAVAIKLITEVCEGLAHAHDHNIIHRDIKPANILLDQGAHAKIGDFGLASASDESDEEGIVYGTPGYAAPEILIDAANVGKPSDIFAIGVMLHQLLTGQMPDDDPRPASRQARCDPRIDRIIRKATKENPAERYQDATEMAADLKAIASTLASSKSLVTASPAATTVAAAPKKFAAPAPQAPREPADAAPAPPQVLSVAPSTNWPFIRNLMIIALLIPVLIFAWGKFKDKDAERTKTAENERIEKQNRALEQEAQRRLATEAAAKQKQLAEEKRAREIAAAERMASDIHEVPDKPPLEQLEDLRDNLKGGARNRFPKGTITYGDRSVFLIEQPMSWSAAAQYAEQYGAHLATPTSQSELAWFSQRMGDNRRIWIGGGALGSDNWGWVTGEEWSHSKPSTAVGSCAAMTDTGVIQARPNGELLPFFLQWTKDGINTGSLEAQLERLQGTLKSPSPAWPPGTLSSQARNYLLVQRSLPWEEADLIATLGGGHLAVASDARETDFIRETLTAYLGQQQAAWLGGVKKGDLWTWSTGETWQKPDWAPNSPDGDSSDTALRFLVDGDNTGWDDADPNEPLLAAGFLIEWSDDKNSAVRETSTNTPAAGGQQADLAALTPLVKKALRRALDSHTDRLKGNQKDYIWELNGWLRSQPKSTIDAHGVKIEAVKEELTDDGIVPAELTTVNLPADVLKIHAAALDRQLRFNNKLQTDLLNMRNAFLGKLLDIKTRLEADNLKGQAAVIQAEIEKVGQGAASLLTYFSLENPLPE